MSQTTLEDRIDLYRSWYRKWQNIPYNSVIDSSFDGCSQWQFTDLDLFDINRYELKDKTFGIIINHEDIPQLILKGVKAEQIIFFSDCDFRTAVAEKESVKVFRLPTTNNKAETKKNIEGFIKEIKNMKKLNYVLNNVPFGLLKEFKALAETLAEDKALIISGSRDYHGYPELFENVELYKYLGACFPNAKVTASVAHINPKGVSQLKIIDKDNKEHIASPNPPIPPGDDINIWLNALNVLKLNLPGYFPGAAKGSIDRKSAKIDPNGIPVIFSAGTRGSVFDESNRATTSEQLVKDNTKYCWATIDPAQAHLIGGLGLHKTVVTHAANEPGHLGNPKYAGPDWGCGTNCWYLPCKDEQDVAECIKYLTHPEVVKLVKGLKSSVTSNSQNVWKKIPYHSQASKWIKNYGS
jgi:hypothetical protein